MTDSEIVKALECCGRNSIAGWLNDCKNCPLNDRTTCIPELMYKAKDLINRLQEKDETRHKVFETKCEELEIAKAEIERLKTNLNVEFDNFASEYDDKIKAEAYKEFAEKAKNEILNRLIKKSQAVKERSEKYNINTEGDVVSLIYNSEIIALNDAIEIIDSFKLNKKREEI